MTELLKKAERMGLANGTQTKQASGRVKAIQKIQPWLMRSIGLLLLVYLLSMVELKELWAIWSKIDKALLMAGIGLAFGMVLVKVERWRILLRAQGIDFPFRPASLAYFSTYYIGVVTPGRVGEILKVFYLRQNTDAGIGAGLVSVLLDRVLDVVVLMGLASLGIWIVPQFDFLSSLWIWTASLVLLAGVILALIRARFLDRLASRMIRAVGRMTRIPAEQGQLDDFMGGLRRTLGWKTMLFACGLTLLSWLFLLLACYSIVLSLSIAVSFWFLSFAMAVAGLVSLLPVSIAGIGVRESVLVALFGLIGINVQASMAYSLLYFAVFSIVLGAVGAFTWYRQPVAVQLWSGSLTGAQAGRELEDERGG